MKYTDENCAYAGLKNHESVNHYVGEYVRRMVHTNGMEPFCSMVKRECNEALHHFSDRHLHRCISEFVDRHNIRSIDTTDVMDVMAEHMAGSRREYKALIMSSRLGGGI